MQKAFGVSLLVSVFFVVGCSQPPEIPQLENSHPESFPEIALRDNLSPGDFRKLFEALNQKGKLNGLKPWFQSLPDSDLQLLGTAVNQYLFQEALNPEGFPSLLENRIQQKVFSRLNKTLADIIKTLPEPRLSLFLKSVVNHAATPGLLKRSSFLFDPNWVRNFEHFKTTKLFPWSSVSDFPNLFTDLKKWAETPSFEKEFLSISGALRNSDLGKSFFVSLSELEESHGESLYSDLSELIQKSLPTKKENNSVVSRLLKLTKILNQPSAGLFSEAQKTLHTEEGEALVRLLGERFEPIILKGTAGFIRETLNEPFDEVELNAKFWIELPRKSLTAQPTANFIHLVRRLQFALDKMAHSSRTIKDPSVTLNSFLLAQWFEQMAKANIDKLSAMESIKFKEIFWQLPITPFAFSVNLLELDDKGKPIKDSFGKYSLAMQIESDLKSIGLEEFANDLKWAIKQESFGPTSIKVALPKLEVRLIDSLKNTILSLHRAHPFADPVPLLTSIVYLFSRPSEGSPFTMSDLESPNMLNSLQNLLRGLSFSQVRKLVTFLFEDLELGNISAEDRERLKSLYPNSPETAELLDNILQSLQVIYDLDQHDSNKVSLLECYHSLLSNSRTQDVRALSKLLLFLSNTDLIGTSGGAINYPNLMNTFSNQDFLTHVFHQLGTATSEQQASFLSLLNFIGGSHDSDSKDLFLFLKDVLLQEPILISSLMRLAESGVWNIDLNNAEKMWIYRFINSDSFPNLYRLIITTSDSNNIYGLITELETLQRNGDLESAIKVLGNMKSDRIQRLASVLWSWKQSHELENFFVLLKTITKS